MGQVYRARDTTLHERGQGRESIETAYALKQLVTAGVRVFFYLENRERTLESPTDKLLLSVTAFADEMEREKARQRNRSRRLKTKAAAPVPTFRHKRQSIRQELRDDLASLRHLPPKHISPFRHGPSETALQHVIERHGGPLQTPQGVLVRRGVGRPAS